VRLLAYALPVLLSLAFVHALTSVTSTPTGSLWVFLGWWSVVSLGASAVVWGVFAATRRLLPLGALYELSLVFPDQAPSRFELALRCRTIESLEERTRLLRGAREAESAQQAAEILLRLVAELDRHDRITAGHAERVRAYSFALGRQVGLSDDELDRLNWAALLHDVGKLEVDGAILNKPGRPSEDEWEQLRLHPLHGETLVAPLREWLGEWADAVGQHHERWDGAGYPRGLAGDEIARAGRIVAIADVFDVITSSRSYKKPASHADARAELVRNAGTQFDPRLVRAFVGLSLGSLRLVVGPLSWLAHAPLLARLPLTPNVGAGLGGVAAVVTTTVILAGPAPAPLAASAHEMSPTKSESLSNAAPRPRTPTRDAEPREPTRRQRPQAAPPRQPGPPSPVPEAPPRSDPDAEPGPTAPPPTPEPPGLPGPTPAPPPETPPPAPTPPAPTPTPPAPPPSPPPPTPAPPPPPPPPPPAPNQPPTFAGGGNQVVFEDAGAQSVGGWASAISAGPPSESSQQVTFTVSTGNVGLFAVQPTVAPDGTLTYTPAANAHGSALVSVTAHDDGGVERGGMDSSATAQLTITVQAVNDAPTCSVGGDQLALSALGGQSVGGFASSSAGPPSESGQKVTFVVSTNRPELFVVQPSISPDGTLTYTPRLLGLGVATVTVRAVDDGGTANGGSDTSAAKTFTITIV
jgi:hypothetical protein